MSEQPLDAQGINPATQESYGWEHVAQDMPGWHPGLQEHAKRQIEARGLLPTAEPTEVLTAPPPDTVINLNTGNAEDDALIPEQPRHPAEEITTAFAESQRTLYKLSADPQFHATCMERGVDPYDDMDKPAYWATVADYTHDRTARMRERGTDSIRIDALELLSTTPAYLFEQSALTQDKTSAPDKQMQNGERRHSKEVVSYFNGLIREFAKKYPETRASDLTTALLNITNISIEDQALRQSANQEIHKTIRGAQHEIAFGQILAQTGRQFRPASLEEDLKGIDYVDDEDTNPMYVDVKASLSELEARGSEGALVRKPDGKLIMYSLVKDSELNGRFHIGDQAAHDKAQALIELLGQTQAA